MLQNSICTDPFPQLASSAVDDCHGNEVSWYPVLSQLVTYLPEHWRLFVDFVYQKLFILTSIYNVSSFFNHSVAYILPAVVDLLAKALMFYAFRW